MNSRPHFPTAWTLTPEAWTVFGVSLDWKRRVIALTYQGRPIHVFAWSVVQAARFDVVTHEAVRFIQLGFAPDSFLQLKPIQTPLRKDV